MSSALWLVALMANLYALSLINGVQSVPKASDLKRGDVVDIGGVPHSVKNVDAKSPSSRGASKMKNITTVVCNQIQTSTNMQNVKPKLVNHTSSSKEHQNLMYKSDLIDFRSKSLLQ